MISPLLQPSSTLDIPVAPGTFPSPSLRHSKALNYHSGGRPFVDRSLEEGCWLREVQKMTTYIEPKIAGFWRLFQENAC